MGARLRRLSVAESSKLLLDPEGGGPLAAQLRQGRFPPQLPDSRPAGRGTARPASTLVSVLKGGRRKVTKKSIAPKYGTDKLAVTELTLRHLCALEHYRFDRGATPSPPLDHIGIAEGLGGGPADFDGLVAAVRAVPTGGPTQPPTTAPSSSF